MHLCLADLRFCKTQMDVSLLRWTLDVSASGRLMKPSITIPTQMPSQQYLQLPKPPARCPVTGLSRSKICELILPCKANDFRPPVLSISLKSNKLAKRGLRIYSVASLLSYIAGQAESASKAQG